jgi:ketosteroid isomerase-like protein
MTSRTRMVLASFLVLAGVLSLARAAEPGSVELEIEHLEHAVNDAYAANKLDKYFSYYADDLVAIFYNERTTLPAYRKFWSEYIGAGNAVTSVKLADMMIRVSPGGDVAVASYQIDVGNRHADGKVTDEHAFETDVWLKRRGTWKIAHAHYALAIAPPN